MNATAEAGLPREAFGFSPTNGGAGEVLRGTGRAMVFGDPLATRVWEGDPQIEIHGPGNLFGHLSARRAFQRVGAA